MIIPQVTLNIACGFRGTREFSEDNKTSKYFPCFIAVSSELWQTCSESSPQCFHAAFSGPLNSEGGVSQTLPADSNHAQHKHTTATLPHIPALLYNHSRQACLESDA